MENHCGASHRIACYIDKWHSLASFIRFGVNVRARAQALWLISKCCSENWSEKKNPRKIGEQKIDRYEMHLLLVLKGMR